MAKTLTQLAADIVAAQASHVNMSADEMDTALRQVFEALSEVKALEEMGPEEIVDRKLRRLRAPARVSRSTCAACVSPAWRSA